MSRLQLNYSTEFRRFVLRDPYAYQHEALSYEMVIERPYADEWRFRFLVWDDGDWQEVITVSDKKQRIQDIMDHEGKAVADIWEQEHTYYTVRDDHPMFKLKAKWLALMELDIFDIPVNHDTWQGKPMSPEAVEAMADARDKEWQRDAEEYAAQMAASEIKI